MNAYPVTPDESARAGVFFVGDDVAPHQHVVVRDSLHVFDVIGQNQQVAESQLRENQSRGLLVAQKLGFQLLQADVAGDLDQLLDQRSSQAATTIAGMDHDTDPAEVTWSTPAIVVAA